MAPSSVIHPCCPVFKHSRQAFEEAIASGVLSNPRSALYAGRFMYMGTWNGVDRFKNIETRQYLAAQ